MNTQTNIHNTLIYMVNNIHFIFKYQFIYRETLCKFEKVTFQITALSHNLIFLIAKNEETTACRVTFERKMLVCFGSV